MSAADRPATAYASIFQGVSTLAGAHADNDLTVVLYMIARAALVQIAGLRGDVRSAELAFRLADEFSTGKPK